MSYTRTAIGYQENATASGIPSRSDVTEGVIAVLRTHGDWTVLQALISFAGAIGIALLIPFVVVLLGLSTLLAVFVLLIVVAVEGGTALLGWVLGAVIRRPLPVEGDRGRADRR